MYSGNARFALTIAPVSVIGNFEWEVADDLYDSGLYLITVYIVR